MIVLGILGLLVLSAPGGFAHASGLSILSTAAFTDSLGRYHIVGEIQNNLQSAIDYVEITATYYNDSNVEVGTWMAFTELDVVDPGVKASFYVVYSDTAVVPQIHNYTLEITYQTASPKPQGLKIVSNSSYMDEDGDMHVTGEIQNLQTKKATYVTAIATFYDAEGTVVDVQATYTQPWTLLPNQTAPFDIIVPFPSQISKIRSYELTCQSLEYSAVVPGYGPITLVFLLSCSTILVLALILILVLKKKTNHKS
jgi:hypothetical protein